MNDDLKPTVPRETFISAMRNVAASVSVVTTDGPAGCAGATVSAFSSVSADPPTVLICLFAESRIAKTVTRNKRFCVNILPEDAQHIADRFAGRHDDQIEDRFCGISTAGTSERGPVLEGATSFDCDLDQVVPSGSHLIIIGRVRDVVAAPHKPLAYRDGAYQRVVLNTPPAHPLC